LEKIISYLKDPAWWFTAVFIAILVSLAAGFLKDAVRNLAARLSTTYRVKKIQEDKEFERELDALLKDQSYMIVTFLRCLMQIMAVFCLLTMFTVVGVFSLVYSFQENTHSFIKGLLLGMALVSGVGGIWGMNYITPRVRVVKAAYSRYRKTILKRVNKNAQQDATPDAQAPR